MVTLESRLADAGCRFVNQGKVRTRYTVPATL